MYRITIIFVLLLIVHTQHLLLYPSLKRTLAILCRFFLFFSKILYVVMYLPRSRRQYNDYSWYFE